MKAMARGRRNSAWSSWEVSRWPEQDIRAWREACRAGGPLDSGGPAADWALATKRIVEALYGTYLSWLERRGELDWDAAPETRFTFERVGRFIRERRAAVSDNTTYNNLGMLAMMLRFMLPGRDWRWMAHHSSAPTRREAMASRQHQAMFDPGLLQYRLLRELEAIHAQPNTWDLAVRQRDCVIVAVAMHTGIRVRNLLMMEIGRHLIARNKGWDLYFEGHETKTGKPIASQVPSVFHPAMARYLSEYRPFLSRGRPPTSFVWLSGRGGGPLTRSGVRETFRRLGVDLLRDHLHPHEVRYVMASTLLAERPNALDIAAAALSHKETTTVSRYYDRSGFEVAHGIWRDLRKKLSRTP